jgi:hypothetical protein
MRTPPAVVRRGGRPKAAQCEQIRQLVADDHVLILEGLAAAIDKYTRSVLGVQALEVRDRAGGG